MTEQSSRKEFLKQCGAFTASLAAGIMMAACGSDTSKGSEKKGDIKKPEPAESNPTDCNDLSGLSQTELNKRKSLGYVKEAPSPDSRCEVCKLYLPPSGDRHCGNCSLFKGPVDTGASCTYFAPLS
jgi:hypothetical protein